VGTDGVSGEGESFVGSLEEELVRLVVEFSSLESVGTLGSVDSLLPLQLGQLCLRMLWRRFFFYLIQSIWCG
jgi:hypothetical protein